MGQRLCLAKKTSSLSLPPPNFCPLHTYLTLLYQVPILLSCSHLPYQYHPASPLHCAHSPATFYSFTPTLQLLPFPSSTLSRNSPLGYSLATLLSPTHTLQLFSFTHPLQLLHSFYGSILLPISVQDCYCPIPLHPMRGDWRRRQDTYMAFKKKGVKESATPSATVGPKIHMHAIP